MGSEASVPALVQYITVLLFCHGSLQVVLVYCVPSEMAVALSWWIHFHYYAMGHRQWDPNLLFNPAIVIVPKDFEIRYVVQIVF